MSKKIQINHVTKKEYKGKNQDILLGYDFTLNEWATFLQLKDQGLTINKGEHGVRLLAVMDNDDKDPTSKKGVKFFTVFNLEQTNYMERLAYEEACLVALENGENTNE